jgi:hypothetical protein
MFEHNTLLHHEMVLLPVEHQLLLFAPHQNQREVVQTLLKCLNEDGEVIHEYHKETFYHVRKDADHAPLKSSGCIA